MANYNINPYGQSAELPAGYPIADNLTTNSAQQALSAKQGVKLREMRTLPSAIVVNAVGDSMTDGWMEPGTSTNKWTDQLASNLGITVNRYSQGGTGYCTGSTYDPFETRMLSMTEQTIDMLLIFGGFNDYNNTNMATSLGSLSDTPALGHNFYASMRHFIEAAINKYPTAIIAIITPMRSSHYAANSRGIKLEDIVNTEIEIARYYGIPCLDFYHEAGVLTSEFQPNSRWTNDGIHPNQACIDKFLAPAFTEFVRETLAFKKPNNS